MHWDNVYVYVYYLFLKMSINWKDVFSVLMADTGISLDFPKVKFNLMDVSYFRNLGTVLEKFSMEDISKKFLF